MIPLAGRYTRQMKTHAHTKTCSGMFIAILFTIAKGGTTQISINWLMDKPNIPYSGILLSHEKECGVLIHVTTWMNPKNILC